MDPSIAENDERQLALGAPADERVVPQDEEDEDMDDDDLEDEDEDDEDDDVGTDENGNEMLSARDAPATGRVQKPAAPNVSSDRVPATDAEPEGSLDKVKTAALGIQEIENLEDDAKGG